MRPISLTICAFGSYGHKEIIDFTKPTQNLFLVTGDTGAGKTTIFDAIVFALYGEASSKNNKKSGEELQSQFVDFGVEPFVELTFLEGNETYKVTRSPRHRRMLKNGKVAATSKSESVSLIMPDGVEYPSKETNKKLEEIVGLTKDQFMQVAMIAQGEFMQVLRDSSNNKKEVFRKLFNTELYEQIVTELEKRVKEKNTEIAKITTICQNEVERVQVLESYENTEALEESMHQILSEDKLNFAALEQFLVILNLMNSEIEEKKGQLVKDYETADKQYDTLNKEHAAANELSKRFQELEEAEGLLSEYATKENEMNRIESLVSDIKLAYEIKILFDSYSDANSSFVAESNALLELKQQLPDLEKQYSEINDSFIKLSKEKEICDGEYNKITDRVRKALEQLDKIEELEKRFHIEQGEKQKLEQDFQNARKELEQLEADENEWRKNEEVLKEAEITDKELQNKKDNLGILDTEYKRIASDLALMNKQESVLSNTQNQYIEEMKVYKQKNEEYEAKQIMFLDAQAGILARKLVSGCACPVCGSLDHPNPCAIDASAKDLSQELIDKLAEEVSELRNNVETISSKAQSQSDVLTEKKNVLTKDIEKLANNLKQMFDVSITIKADSFADNVLDLDTALTKIRNDIQKEEESNGLSLKQLADIRKNLSTIEERKNNMRINCTKLEQNLSSATTRLGSVEGELKSLHENKDYETREKANQAFQVVDNEKKNLDDRYKDIQSQHNTLNNSVESCKARIKQCEERIPGLQKEAEEKKRVYDEFMTEQKKTQSWWKDLVDSYKKDTSEYETILKDYHANKGQAMAVKKTAIQAIGDRKLPDIERLVEGLDAARIQKTNIGNQKSALESIYSTNISAYEALVRKTDERGSIMTEYDRLYKMYQTLAGKVSGAKMDIETFAQRYYLERILDSANVRFFDMSTGQFELRLLSLDEAGVGKNRGLDLTVYSNITGMEREITTLSGGESFMAALALALGMADVIQEKSSSINLDIMFIDEGFGSLDDHSRAEAVKVLKSMAGGSKLIGIISHVSELKQEIDDMLLVKKDEKGSRTEWVLS